MMGHLPANQLPVEGRGWLEQLVGIQPQRLNFAQHREVLHLADLMAIGTLQIDRGRKPYCLWLGPTGSGKSAAG